MMPYESDEWREHQERERQRRLATRMLVAIIVLTLLAALLLCVGCADMSRTPSERQAPRADDGSRAKWQRQWELLAAAAESPTADVEHSRVLDAMEHAASMRDSAAPDPATSRAGSAPSDNTAPTLARAAEALGELANKER